MPKKRPSLTPKQRIYLKNIALGKNKGEAAREAGYSKASSENPQAVIEAHIGEPLMRKALEKQGMTEEWIAKRLRRGAYSKKAIPTKKGVKYVPENMARARFMELIGKWRKDFVEKHEITGPNGKPIETKTEIIIGGFVEKA